MNDLTDDEDNQRHAHHRPGEAGGAGSLPGNALLVAYQAALTVASETRLDAVLQRLVDLARDVASARYAALGVADDAGQLRQLIYAGITAEEAARIGPLPEGHGLLGVLIHAGKPLLIPDISADPRSVGFPPEHPSMRTLLGVPILLDEQPIGNLYLAERIDSQPFAAEDLAAVEVLAAHAATVIQRARLIAEIERSRREAEAQRDHVQVIIDQLPAGVVIVLPPDRRIEHVNLTARRMLAGKVTDADGASPEDPRQTTHPPRLHFRRADGTALPEREWPGAIALTGATVSQLQLTLVPDEGAPVPVFVHASPLFGPDGTVASAVVVFQDMTRLREAERLRDDFLSLVSHEFRTPLTTIHGGAQLLSTQRDALDSETEQVLLTDITLESARLDQMMGNILRLADVMAGRLQMVTEPVLIGPLVQRISREMARRVPDVCFAADIPTALPPVEGDPALLEQVVRNLYENALKYSPGEKYILTSAESADGMVVVRVIDHGSGIAPEYVPLVFERFRRPGADPAIRGMGLGLYLSRQLITAQGGQIWAASEGVGRGATFSFSLPVAFGWNVESE